MQYILVGLGGIVGSITRYSLGKFIGKSRKHDFPVCTFIINITGAALLGILSAIVIDKTVYSFLGDGILGGYTTFSTFMYEGFNLFKDRKKLNAFTYMSLSIILGVAFYGIGFSFGGLV